MAVARLPFTVATATVTVLGTSVAAGSPVPDNCVGMTLTNVGVNAALVGIAVPGTALADGTTGFRLGVGASVSLPLGPVGLRGVMDQSQLAGSGLVYDALTTAPCVVQIVYQNQIGGTP